MNKIDKMLRSNDLKSNVLTETTTKAESWKKLNIKNSHTAHIDPHPNTTRVSSKENIRIDTKIPYRAINPHFSSNGSETHRNQSSNYRDDPFIEKQLEKIEHKLSDINILKNQLNSSYRDKREELRRREKELILNELEFKKKYSAFEEERNKWCMHISLKINETKNKEVEMELFKIQQNEQLEKSKRIEEAYCKMQSEFAMKNLKLEEAELKNSKREENLWRNEERLAMKIEDIAAHEYNILSYEKILMKKAAELECVNKKIEEKNNDINKTAEMFEKINDQLKLESKRVNIQTELNNSERERLKAEEQRLKQLSKKLEKFKDEFDYREKCLNKKRYNANNFTNYLIKDHELCNKPSNNINDYYNTSDYDVRTPE